jgi:mercuric ion transport protein
MIDHKSSLPFLRNSATAGGVIGSFAALAGASCCVLPLLLIQAGVATGLVTQLAWFARYKDPIFGIAILALALSIGLSLYSGKPSKKLIIWWSFAILILIAAYFAPSFELELRQWLLNIIG